MPTALRVRGYRLFFYAGDKVEPRHVHVESGAGEAKFWLTPVTLAYAVGYSQSELLHLHRLVEQHRAALLEAWDDFFGDADDGA